MKFTQLCCLVLFLSVFAFAQSAKNSNATPKYKYPATPTVSNSKSNAHLPVSTTNATASTAIARANRDTANEQQQLNRIEHGNTQVHTAAPNHQPAVKAPKEPEHNPPINFNYHAPKQQTGPSPNRAVKKSY